jgi:prolipoprotein diacylglyceryltransferase
LYDIVLLCAMAVVFLVRLRRPWANGRMFRWFMLGYLSWRCLVEFIKPRDLVALNLSAIQIASLAGAAVAGWLLRRGPSRVTPAGRAVMMGSIPEAQP